MATPVSFQKKALGFDFSMSSIMAIAKRRRYFTISILSWVAILALIALVLVPAVQSILAIQKDLETASAELTKKQQLITGLSTLDANELQRANTILAAALPIEKPVLPVLYSIDRLATEATVSVSNFQVSPGLLGTSSGKLSEAAQVSKISPQIATLPLKMGVSGGFGNLSTFFQSLDNVVPFIQINSIQFSSEVGQTAATSTESATYTAEVSLSSLYLKSALAKGTVTSVAPLNTAEKDLLQRLTLANEATLADSAKAGAPIIATSSALQFIDRQ